MRIMITNSIKINLLLFVFTFSIQSGDLLTGEWYNATGKIESKFYDLFIGFKEDGEFSIKGKTVGTYKVQDDSTISIKGLGRDTIYSFYADDEVLVVVNSKDRKTVFLRKAFVYPSIRGKYNSHIESAWQSISSWGNETDTLTFKDGVVISAKAQSAGSQYSKAKYRCINDKFIEFTLLDEVTVEEYYLNSEYAELISPFFSNRETQGFIELTDKPQEFSKKLAREIIGRWISTDGKGIVEFTESGGLFSRGDSVGNYTVLSDTLVYFGDKMKANIMWYEVSNGILLLTENSFNDDGDISLFLDADKILKSDQIIELYKGEWQIHSLDSRNSQGEKFYLLVEDSMLHYYNSKERSYSRNYKIASDGVTEYNGRDSMHIAVLKHGDTLVLSNGMKLTKSYLGLKSEPYEISVKESLPMLLMYEEIPADSSKTYLEKIKTSSGDQFFIEIMEGNYFIHIHDSLSLSQAQFENDSVKLVIGKSQRYLAGKNDLFCPVYLVKKSAVFTGGLIDSIKANSIRTTFGKEQTITFILSEEGKREFERVTKENVGKKLITMVNGVVHSTPTVNEMISGGEFSINISRSESDRWQDGIDRLKTFGLSKK